MWFGIKNYRFSDVCKRFAIVLLVLLSFSLKAKDWYSGLFRVNTQVSAGTESFTRIAEKAKKADLDFIVFSDQFLVEAQYGLPPFRDVIKYTKTRRSVVTYGIEKYLDEINKTDTKFPDMVLVPGADIAPLYYWSGSPFNNSLTTNQYSEQLTIFGSDDPELYRRLPVIHNDQWEDSYWKIAVKLLPLLISVIGILLCIKKKSHYYSDAQGNVYDKGHWKKVVVGICFILCGICTTINLKPFTKYIGFSQYSAPDILPFQNVIDYIRDNSGDETGIIWSAPEATMNDRIWVVSLFTAPYLGDIERTYKHNGLAGIYGDAITAYNPGKSWDKMLLEYCSGKRKLRPVITGELDYHGKKRRINHIQTVIQTDSFDRKGVVKAIISGNSYAVIAEQDCVELSDAYIESGISRADLGETLSVKRGNDLSLKIKGHLIDPKTNVTYGQLIVVVNGEKVVDKMVSLKELNITEKINIPASPGKLNYVRFYIKNSSMARLLTNPFFFKVEN